MDASSVRRSIQERLEELRPLIEEYATLQRVEAVLGEHTADNGNRTEDAPYGYKADGTPYRRRPPSAEEVQRRVATRMSRSGSRG